MRRLLTFSACVAALVIAWGGALADTESSSPPAMPRVTARFSGADLTETLYRLFLGTNLRYEAPQDFPGTFSCDLEEVPLDQALRLLLEPRGLTFTREGNVFRIRRKEGYVPPSEQVEKERQERLRRLMIEQSKKPRPQPERPRVRFLPAEGHVQIWNTYFLPPGYEDVPIWLLGPGMQSPDQRLVPPAPPASQALQVGPLSISLPPGLRRLPGGGWELFLPNTKEITTTTPLGTFTTTVPGEGGLTIRRR